MRDLEKNKVSLWMVYPSGERSKVLDDEGFFTGYYTSGYSEPEEIKIPLSPTTGEKIKEVFGVVMDYGFISNTGVNLQENTLLFRSEPTDENYSDNFDYEVERKLTSLNSFTYLLKGRV